MSAPNHFSSRARERLIRELGPEITAALNDAATEEIMLNPDGRLYIEKHRLGLMEMGHMDPTRAEGIVRTVASILDRELPPLAPILSAELPFNGARFEGLLPPLSRAPIFSLRRHTALHLNLGELTAQDFLTAEQKKVLVQAVGDRLNLIIAGETGCGKTTLLNALLGTIASLSPEERIITLEDTPELDVDLPDTVSLFTSDRIGLSDLLRSALRLRPDRIILGEIRGPEALDVLDAFSTGHRGGMVTLHAGSVSQALKRLELLISRNPEAPRESTPLIREAIDMIVILSRRPHRHVSAIARLEDVLPDTVREAA